MVERLVVLLQPGRKLVYQLFRRTRMHIYLVIMFLAERKVSLVTFLKAEDVAVGVDGGSLTPQG